MCGTEETKSCWLNVHNDSAYDGPTVSDLTTIDAARSPLPGPIGAVYDVFLEDWRDCIQTDADEIGMIISYPGTINIPDGA